jgi:alkylated DNA repair dioxygenase AlkB
MSVPTLIEDDFLEDNKILFNTLISQVNWNERMAARKTASFGVPYDYSQISYPRVPLLPALIPVAERLNERLGISFNNCLLNYYESGEQTMGFHSDDTSSLLPGTGVAIVSLGHARDITYRSKADKMTEYSFSLLPGSLLYMNSEIQEEWLHGIRKQAEAGPRISLTWRAFLDE